MSRDITSVGNRGRHGQNIIPRLRMATHLNLNVRVGPRSHGPLYEKRNDELILVNIKVV